MTKLITAFRILGVVAVLGLAPAAHAGVPATVSRDTGVGLQIAAQGNQALVAIRAEVRRTIKSWRPALPAQVLPVSLPVTAPAGGAVTVAPTQRCAK